MQKGLSKHETNKTNIKEKWGLPNHGTNKVDMHENEGFA